MSCLSCHIVATYTFANQPLTRERERQKRREEEKETEEKREEVVEKARTKIAHGEDTLLAEVVVFYPLCD
jgi:hypothetical protein